MKKLLCVLSLSMIVLLTAASISYSDTYEIIQITTNDYYGAYPQINAEGDVVWNGQTGSNIYDYDSLEIFYYDTSEETTSQITDNTYRDLNPQINASGDVVWHGFADDNFEIFLYDGSTTTQLTFNTDSTEVNNFSPQINANGDVVWTRRPYPSYYQVYLYDRTDKTASMLPLSQYGLSPQINTESHVVWYKENQYQEIDLYNGTETIRLDTNTTNLDQSPQINPNGDVVWYGYDGTGSEIFLYDGSTTIQLTDNDYYDTNPQINESGDVVWRGKDGTDYDYEIYYYDRSSGVTTQLTDNHYDDGYPQINANGEVVWDADDGTNHEIFLYDGSTTIQLTHNDYDDFSPQINANSEVVWHGGYDKEDYYLIGEIFLARRIPDNQPPTADAGENITIFSEEITSTAIQGSATDEDSDDSLNCRWLEGETVLHDWTPVGENDECLLYLISTSIGVGTHTLTLEVTDSHATASDDMILIIENSDPHAAPTGGGVYEIFAPVTLAGEVSDFDGDTLTCIWLGESGILFSESVSTISGGSPVSLTEQILDSLSLGTHTLTLSVRDGINDPGQSNITVEVIDTGAPTLVPIPDKTILWPPNHKMIDITIEANASDNSGDPVTLSAVVTSNEPEDGLGDGDQSPDWTESVIDQDSGIITLQLRAERSGSGDGRIYGITITAIDESNNSSQAVVEIIVPHHKGTK